MIYMRIINTLFCLTNMKQLSLIQMLTKTDLLHIYEKYKLEDICKMWRCTANTVYSLLDKHDIERINKTKRAELERLNGTKRAPEGTKIINVNCSPII